MVSDIFQVDWVFFDTLIIILLFLLLLGVKIFKTTHRWRVSFNNEALEYYSFSKANRNEKSHLITEKHTYLIKNNIIRLKNNNFPLILILRTNGRKKLCNVLSEGLSSYGFNVIIIKIKAMSSKSYKLLKENISKEFKSLIKEIISYFQKKNLITQSKYLLINSSKSSFFYDAIFDDSKNLGVILVNPNLNIFNFKIIQNFSNNITTYNQLFTIFSKKSIFFFKNKNLKLFLSELKKRNIDKTKIITLEKANRSFKYYETLLLGIIIDLIEDQLINYKN